MKHSATLALSLCLAACSSQTTSPSADAGSGTDVPVAVDTGAPQGDTGNAPADIGTFPGAALIALRPFVHRAPSDYSPSRRYPLVVLLHGYGASGMLQDIYFGFSRNIDAMGAVLAIPDGTLDTSMRRFWAAGPCCNFGGVTVDDVAYVTAIIDAMSAMYNVDPNRVYLVGHSNGGFMAHYMACRRADRIAAIVSLAGAGPLDPASCTPSRPVAVLEVHGDRDTTIPFAGGMIAGLQFPGARDTVAGWARRNRCMDNLMPTARVIDLDTGIMGAETTNAQHFGCAPGGAADLWTIVGGAHLPALSATTWPMHVMDWLRAHPRP